MKRLFDITAALVALLLLALPLLALTWLVRRKLGRPAFFRQVRPGLHGKPFEMVKLRSMTDARRPDGALLPDADRLTLFGRFLRASSVDELPGLWNVLKGDMSLVGPRPERQYFVEQLTRDIPFYAVRHSVKPGVTGWAQVRYHYAGSLSDTTEKLQYDLYYVKNHSLFLDFVILFETVGVVLTGKGAQ